MAGAEGLELHVAISREVWNEYLSFHSLLLWMRKLRPKRGGVDLELRPHPLVAHSVACFIYWGHSDGPICRGVT